MDVSADPAIIRQFAHCHSHQVNPPPLKVHLSQIWEVQVLQERELGTSDSAINPSSSGSFIEVKARHEVN